MHSAPLAYLLTWTAYGTHLHHDRRGSVNTHTNTYGNPVLPADSVYLRMARDRMNHPPVTLSVAARRLVSHTITEHCRIRCWKVLAQNPRTQHIHAVVHAPNVSPETVLSQLKAWTTRRLREAGHIGPGAPAWTHHGSTLYLFNDESLARACNYVLNEQ